MDELERRVAALEDRAKEDEECQHWRRVARAMICRAIVAPLCIKNPKALAEIIANRRIYEDAARKLNGLSAQIEELRSVREILEKEASRGGGRET